MDDTVEVRRDTGCCRFEVSCEVRRFTSLDRTRWLVLDSIPDFSDTGVENGKILLCFECLIRFFFLGF